MTVLILFFFFSSNQRASVHCLFDPRDRDLSSSRVFAEAVRAEEINSGTLLTPPLLPREKHHEIGGDLCFRSLADYKKKKGQTARRSTDAKGELPARRETKRRRRHRHRTWHEDAGEPAGWCMTSGAPTARRRWHIDQCPVQPTSIRSECAVNLFKVFLSLRARETHSCSYFSGFIRYAGTVFIKRDRENNFAIMQSQ